MTLRFLVLHLFLHLDAFLGRFASMTCLAQRLRPLFWLSVFVACTKTPASHTALSPEKHPLAEASSPPPVQIDPYIVTRAMVPMRDGVKLETMIFAPRDAKKNLPILFMRSPYGVPPDSKFLNHPVHAALVRDGYIWVFQNLRGRFASEGSFVMDRPPRNANDPLSIDESSDAYDSIEWLVHHVPGHNGRVGMTGTSYDALTAVLATVEPHPALKAVVEEATPADQFIGDDFHHNGAFRLAYAFEYVALLESSKSENTRFQFDDRDIFDFHAKVGPLSNIDRKYFHGKMPTWNDFVAHPNNDAFWQSRSFDAFINGSSVPILHCVGWWDQEDFYGPLHAYARIEKNDRQHHNQIVIGPWNHGGWYSEGRNLLSVDFGSATGAYYREKVKAPWLARYLHETGEGVRDEATVFVTGANTWRSFKSWPPKDLTSEKKLYLHAGNTLSFEAPSPREKAKFSKYVSDPEDPVPFLPRPIDPLFSGPQWSTWQAVDQTFLEHRTDVLSFSTPPLTSDLTIAGNLRFELFASTTGSDSDWVVKVIDVYPASEMKSETRPTEEGMTEKQDRADGYQLMIVGEVLRGRYRKSFVVPSPITPNKTIPYTINLHSQAHTFRRGHRMMIQVQSTWFPLIDRNPQTYVSNIYLASEDAFQPAEQRIWHHSGAASALVMDVLNEVQTRDARAN